MSNLKNIKNNSTDAHRLLKMVGLEVLDTMKIKNYSFGMKKKISLAQALIGEPRLLFLDEPTSGVDPESIINIQKLIVDLNKKGTTIFLTSHNLNEIEKICTSIAILKGGHIDLCGSITDIRKSFCKNITVTIKADIPSDISDISEFVVTKMVNSNKNVFTFKVDSEEEIAYIITQIVNKKGSIYSVTQNSITLEEIFLK
ncbi:ABC transporter ATP-binding protein [Ruminiclostridium josui]|nr:ABC transporter ATP-binding protein [Ruminiclostridium josui]